MRGSRKYFTYLDRLKGQQLTDGPDTIELLLAEFSELNKATALSILVDWAERSN